MVDDPTRAGPGDPTADGTGVAHAATETDPRSSDATIIPSWGNAVFAALPDPGYQLGELIGRGGMGEVVVAQDQRIGREVAVKRILSKAPSHDAVTRFLREARIQARLDHPAIVPVYELGTDADGRPYFTMKRLAGVTLAQRLAEHAAIQPLLRAFVDVCLAIQLAHARGVVHRDIKPSNIMLGDYGEVYVLDWGVARVQGDRRSPTRPGVAEDVDDETTAGAILGTPGYMSPEQVRGTEIGPPTDIYALGAILFELLAGEALHPRGEAALASTLTQPQDAPARRASDRSIPPELDGACFDALADDPAQRPTARQLADRVQAYLDGDRDLERRRALATTELAAARVALEGGGADARSIATRRAGRALALDQESVEAAALVTTLILEPPERLPPDLVDSLHAADLVFNAGRARAAMWTMASLFAFWAVVPLLGVKSWPMLTAFYVVVGVGTLWSWWGSRNGRTNITFTLVVSTLLLLLFTRFTGPFILTPIVACAVLISITALPHLIERPWTVVAWVIVATMLPLVLEWLGLIDRSYDVSAIGIVSVSDIFENRGAYAEHVTLVATNVLFLAITAGITLTINRRRRAAQRKLHIQAWHLRQLLPPETRPWQTRPGGAR